MYNEFKKIKKEGYGVIHAHDLGSFLVMPLKKGCTLAELLGEKVHKKGLKKINQKKTAKKKKLISR